MATINFELRNRPDKKGYCLLRICIQDRGKRVYIATPLKLLPSHWDEEKQKVKSLNSQHRTINNVLELKMAELQGKMANESLHTELALEKIAGRKVSKTSFRLFAGECLMKWDKTKSEATIKAYTSMLNQLGKYDKNVSVEEISPAWLAQYEHHCRLECQDAGTLKRVAFVSVVLKEAIRSGIIDRDPFLIYQKPKKRTPPRVWLTLEELERIEDLAERTKSEVIRNTCYWFLLACYTGLRYSDIANFTPDMIQQGRLILYTQKTGEIVSIKLTHKIKTLIALFPAGVYSNQKMNQYLKAVAHHAKINKLVTFHTARHSFAVNCANLGISQEVASKLLGHSDLKTTAIYYKIVNERVDREMDKWNQ